MLRSVRTASISFEPFAHDATSVTYRAHVKLAGTALGVRLRGWPRGAQLLGLRWVGGEDVVVPTYGGFAPAHLARQLRFWSKGGEMLEVQLGGSRVAGFRGEATARNPQLRPWTLVVAPLADGTARVVPSWTQGGK